MTFPVVSFAHAGVALNSVQDFGIGAIGDRGISFVPIAIAVSGPKPIPCPLSPDLPADSYLKTCLEILENSKVVFHK